MTATKKTPRDAAAVRYRIEASDPKGHYFTVTCEVASPNPAGQIFSLPAWIPGSYMIREFARNIVSIAAACDGQPVALIKRDKHTWQAAPCEGPLVLRYEVYAWDPSVRAAHLDETHAFFNGSSVFLKAHGLEDVAHDVEIVMPTGPAHRRWRVATTLPEHGARRHGFGRYRACDYDALIDHPVECGAFRLERFDAVGVAHEIAYTGVIANIDAERINADVATICAAQIRFFDGIPGASSRRRKVEAPFDRYVFLTAVTGDGYGGLEHRSSTALVCSRDALPALGEGDRDGDRSSAYLTFLGLVSHEYFHSWNVKRIKPAAFAPYDLSRENHTSLLWIFEGFTSYYDDLFLVRTGLATELQYFGMLARTIDDVMAGGGRTIQSVADSSFDAWTKYYRQDENAPNAIVSYYKKGSLVALCLDLLVRAKSGGEAALDDAMRLLWRRHGRDFYEGGGSGIAEDAFPGLVEEATGIDVADEIARWAYGTEDLPLAELLAAFGLELREEAPQTTPTIGVRVTSDAGETRLATVFDRSAAHAAGLSAGDVLLAIDGLRIAPGRLDAMLARRRVGDVVEVASFRADVLRTVDVKLEASRKKVAVEPSGRSSKKAAMLRASWLTGTSRAKR